MTDQNRAWNRPQHYQRLAVEPAEQDGEQAVDEKDAEDPGRDLVLGKLAVRTDGENDGNRRAHGKQPAGKAVQGVVNTEIGKDLAKIRRAFSWSFEACEYEV